MRDRLPEEIISGLLRNGNFSGSTFYRDYDSCSAVCFLGEKGFTKHDSPVCKISLGSQLRTVGNLKNLIVFLSYTVIQGSKAIRGHVVFNLGAARDFKALQRIIKQDMLPILCYDAKTHESLWHELVPIPGHFLKHYMRFCSLALEDKSFNNNPLFFIQAVPESIGVMFHNEPSENVITKAEFYSCYDKVKRGVSNGF